MKKILLFLSFLLMSIGMWGATISVSIEDYASTHSWINDTKYSSITIDENVTATASGTTYTGKYYTTDNSWRFYANETGTLGLTTTVGEFNSVTLVFNVKDNGKILCNGNSLTSGTAVSVSGSSISFVCGSTSGTNGKVLIKSISVTYSGGSSHTITYKSNGTTDSDRKQTSSDETVTLYTNTYTRSGYIFDNWNTKADGTGYGYDEGTTYTLSSDITLYAKWLEDAYAQKFGSNCNIFSENWNETASTGGNDGLWNGNAAQSASTVVSDKTGWTFISEHGGSSCIKLGTTGVKGSAETPYISYSGNKILKLSFKAGAWDHKDEKTTLKISATNAMVSMSEIELSKGSWTIYTLSLTGITNDFKVKWEAKNASYNRFFLDSICISSSESPIDIVTWHNDSIFLSKDYFNEIDFKADSIRIKPLQSKKKLYEMPDSTLKVNVDLSGSYCNTLHFIVCNSTEAIEQHIKIPYIVESTNTTDAISADKDCDVVIHKTLTINNDDKENRNVTVYPGGLLNVKSNYTVNSLTLRQDNDSVPYFSLNGTLSTDKLFFELRTDGSDWRWLTLPDTFDISVINGNVYDINDNKGGILINEYDGEYRSLHGRGGWKESAKNRKFNPGEGLNIGVWIPTSDTEKRIYRIPLNTNILNKEKLDKSVQVYAYHGNSNTPPNDKGWNVVGNPYMDIYKSDLTEPIQIGKLKKDSVNGQWTGKWVLDEESVSKSLRYIVVKNYDKKFADANYYETVLLTDGYNLKPFTSFFI